ncbi:MAG: class I SAM-dependent methyltransferase [Candidatus Nanopelagicales bacterium]
MTYMEDFSGYVEMNQANWDSRVSGHLTGYDINTLRSKPDAISDVVRFDIPRIGDVKGLRGIHLQCHIGTDTVSLTRRGANMVGLDFSEKSIEAARNIAKELGADIPYVLSNVYDTITALEDAGIEKNFDFVFTGVGALCWLPEIKPWAKVVSSLLKPGGFLFLREGHPMLWSIGESYPDGSIRVEYEYFEGTGIYMEEEKSYTGDETLSSPGSISFNHSLSEIFNALWDEGLEIVLFEEHRNVPFNPLADEFVRLEGIDEWELKTRPNRLAASYSLKAIKK